MNKIFNFFAIVIFSKIFFEFFFVCCFIFIEIVNFVFVFVLNLIKIDFLIKIQYTNKIVYCFIFVLNSIVIFCKFFRCCLTNFNNQFFVEIFIFLYCCFDFVQIIEYIIEQFEFYINIDINNSKYCQNFIQQ